MALDNLSKQTHSELEDIATKHSSFESFMQDVQRLADLVWHNVRGKGHDPHSIVGDAEKDPVPNSIVGDVRSAQSLSAEAPSPASDNEQSTSPAEPASPQSEAGYPTSNVDVEQPSQPVESHPAG